MKALSIRQPWTWLIGNGEKNIENRTWPLPRSFELPQRIYLHAGKGFDWAAADHIEGISSTGYEAITSLLEQGRFGKLRGAIVGEVTITGCVTESDSPWFTGPYGFVLRDPVAYETPTECRGHLGFWTPPEMEAEA